MDASFRFPNKSADRLEPFSDKDLTEFDSRFLSGYYADLRDEDFLQLKSRADMRAKKIYNCRYAAGIPQKNDILFCIDFRIKLLYSLSFIFCADCQRLFLHSDTVNTAWNPAFNLPGISQFPKIHTKQKISYF